VSPALDQPPDGPVAAAEPAATRPAYRHTLLEVLDDLIDQYGAGAVVTAHPVTLDSGVTYRWEILIDGKRVPDVSVHAHGVRGRPNQMVVMMVHDGDEIEIARWSTERPEPASIVLTLGDLRRDPQASA
jgi:hypothetical protein